MLGLVYVGSCWKVNNEIHTLHMTLDVILSRKRNKVFLDFPPFLFL